MKRHSLKLRFAATIAIVYLVLGVLTFLAFRLVTDKIVRSLGTGFATKEALLEKSRMMSAIQRDLSLSEKMAGSPLLVRWAEAEDDAMLKKAATEELESYRTSLLGRSLFFAIDASRNYYFSDGTSSYTLAKPRYQLTPDNRNDAWYFRTMRDVANYELNVDYDNHLDVTKVWFNVIVKGPGGSRIGMCGSGIDITEFVEEITRRDESGMETILIGTDGSIQGSANKEYVIRNSKVRGSEKKITVFDLMSSAADRTALTAGLESLSSGTQETATFFLTIEGKRRLAAMAHLKEIRWFNLVLLDPAHVVSTRNFLPILFITALSLLALLLIVGFLLNRLVLTPLSSLAESSNQIAAGNFDISMPIRTEDEIGGLTRSFNEMARMVKDHSENLEQKVRSRTEELDLSNHMLAESNRQIMDSIRYAELIQTSILPQEVTIAGKLREFFALYRPRDIVGGDFYYFRAAGEECVLAVIDCTGHSVPGAFMTMTANAVLDRVLDMIGVGDPAAILKELNRLLRAALHSDTPCALPIDNGLDIGLCSCSPLQGKLVYAGARIDLFHVMGGGVETIHADKQSLGYRNSNEGFSYTNHVVTAGPDSLFFMASDGILDQSGGPKGWSLGRKGLSEILLGVAEIPSSARSAALERALSDYQGDAPQRDDITIIGFRM